MNINLNEYEHINWITVFSASKTSLIMNSEIRDVEEANAIRHHNDFYGLLNSMDISSKYYTANLIANGLLSPSLYSSDMLQIRIVSATLVDNIIKLSTTSSPSNSR